MRAADNGVDLAAFAAVTEPCRTDAEQLLERAPAPIPHTVSRPAPVRATLAGGPPAA